MVEDLSEFVKEHLKIKKNLGGEYLRPPSKAFPRFIWMIYGWHTDAIRMTYWLHMDGIRMAYR